MRARGFENLRLKSEDVAEFDYSPGHCRRSYRVVVVRKNLSVERGEWALFDDVRYFFYITNDRQMSVSGVVRSANGRCNQENLIGQLKGGVQALNMPVDNLVSNAAYMVMGVVGLDVEGVVCLVVAGDRPVACQAQVGEGRGTEDGVQDLPRLVHEDPRAGGSDGASHCVSRAGLESLVARLLPWG